ncbi:hypothetical protein GW796_09735 [archaeon]|nr:hypothetical protein [archaeon]
MNQEYLDLAFCELLTEISAGIEYPDALWNVNNKFKVPGEALQFMYNAHCE